MLAKWLSFRDAGWAMAPADTSSLASKSQTYGAPKQYPTQAYLVSAWPYRCLTAAVHLGTASSAKAMCLLTQPWKSKLGSIQSRKS